MKIKLLKTDQGYILPIPPSFLEQLEIQEGDLLRLSLHDGALLIHKEQTPRRPLQEIIGKTEVSPPCQEWDVGEEEGQEKNEDE